MQPYQPAEDSFLLLEQVKKYARGVVLDIGTGTGIQAIAAARKAKFVVGVDINRKAVKLAEENAVKNKLKNVLFVHSDLFGFFEKYGLKIKNKTIKKFSTIIFNPPYLPKDKGINDSAIYGGKKGWELIERFFSEANGYLEDEGVILLLFSSLTHKPKVDEIVETYLFEPKQLSEQSIFFEKLYVYLVKKSSLLKILNKKNIKNMKKFAKGHRGLVYTGLLNNKKIAVKQERADIGAKNVIKNEINYLKLLNKKSIAPKLLFSGRDYFAYEFVEGRFIIDFIEKNTKSSIKKAVVGVFSQCYLLDKLGINKEEMHHPVKHIIITKKKQAVLIDFERARKTKDPKNVSQFCQFVSSNYLRAILEAKKIALDKHKIIELAKNYKNNFDKKSFESIIGYIRKL